MLKLREIDNQIKEKESFYKPRLDCLSLLRLGKEKLSDEKAEFGEGQVCEIILGEILKKSRTELYLKNTILEPEEIKLFESRLNSVIKGAPLAYLLKKAYFFGLEFFVDENCFIPRPETEILVEKTIELTKVLNIPRALIIEVGAGSGNIALSLTKFLSCCRIVAVDISKNALEIAKKNSLKHKTSGRLRFVCCDMLKALNEKIRADIIVSNPPYIRSSEIKSLPENVRQEPRVSLDGGVDGLEVIRRLFQSARYYLKEGGFLIFEFGCGQGVEVKEIALKEGIFRTIEIVKDYNGLDRIFIGRKIAG